MTSEEELIRAVIVGCGVVCFTRLTVLSIEVIIELIF